MVQEGEYISLGHRHCPVRKVLSQPHHHWFKMAGKSRSSPVGLTGEDIDNQPGGAASDPEQDLNLTVDFKA